MENYDMCRCSLVTEDRFTEVLLHSEVRSLHLAGELRGSLKKPASKQNGAFTTPGECIDAWG